MMLTGLARIGRDVELKTVGQETVANISLAYNYGKKGGDGKRPTQWVDASLWGKRAESLAPYLKKGGLVSVTLQDVAIHTYEGNNGPGHALRGRVLDIELAGGSKDAPAAPAAATPPPVDSGFDDSDVPF